MILLIFVFTGLLALLVRIYLYGGKLSIPDLRGVWLVPLAFILQWLILRNPVRFENFPGPLGGSGLVFSQLLLLLFAWFNRKQPGFIFLGLGLALNFAVIALNGGWMPIDPATVARLIPDAPPGTWQIGQRLGASKDIVIPEGVMRLGFLSDRWLLPRWISYQVAFSLGDVVLGAGAFWFTASLAAGNDNQPRKKTGDLYANEPVLSRGRSGWWRAKPASDRCCREPEILPAAADQSGSRHNERFSR